MKVTHTFELPKDQIEYDIFNNALKAYMGLSKYKTYLVDKINNYDSLGLNEDEHVAVSKALMVLSECMEKTGWEI